MSSNSVWLLKSPESDDSKLNTLLRASNFNPQFVPTVSKKFINVEELREKLSQIDHFSGIFFTSLTAVEAVANILLKMPDLVIQKWKCLRHFVIGEEIYKSVKSKLGLEAFGRNCIKESEVIDAFMDKMEVFSKPLLLPCRYNSHQYLKNHTLPSLGNSPIHYFFECFSYRFDKYSIDNFYTALQNSGVPSAIVIYSTYGLLETMGALKQILGLHMTDVKLIVMSPFILNALLKFDYHVQSVLTKPNAEQLVFSIKESISH